MKSSPNKVVAAVFAVLVVGVIVLGVSSGSCSGGGGSARPPGADAAGGETIDHSITTDGLRDLLDEYDVPVGANARSADAAQDVLTAAEAYAAYRDRGFDAVTLEADVTADGSLRSDVSVSADSPERYPSYRAVYESPTAVVWLVYLNGGAWLATPVGDADQTRATSLIFAESAVVTQYDATRNQFSDFTFDELDGAKGVQVDRIDAATLDGYTTATLGKM